MTVTRNMYGCYPCPKCGSKYRYALAKAPNTAICDQCGYNEENADISYEDEDQ